MCSPNTCILRVCGVDGRTEPEQTKNSHNQQRIIMGLSRKCCGDNRPQTSRDFGGKFTLFLRPKL